MEFPWERNPIPPRKDCTAGSLTEKTLIMQSVFGIISAGDMEWKFIHEVGLSVVVVAANLQEKVN